MIILKTRLNQYTSLQYLILFEGGSLYTDAHSFRSQILLVVVEDLCWSTEQMENLFPWHLGSGSHIV